MDGSTPISQSQMNSVESADVHFMNSLLVITEDSMGLKISICVLPILWYSPDSLVFADQHAHPFDPACLLDLPDNYLCEGSPDKMMMDAFKELNIQDI